MKRQSVALSTAFSTAALLLVAVGAHSLAVRLWLGGNVLTYLEHHGALAPGHEALLHRARWTFGVVSVVALVFVASAAGLITGLMARSRLRPVVRALDRIAAGEFAVRLPPTREVELGAVQDALSAMATALDGALGRLAHADSQRRRLFADLAHELATPASSIAGLADTLARPDLVPGETERAALLETLTREAARLARLVDDVRQLAELDDPASRLDREPLDLGDHARDVAARVARARPDRARIETAIESVRIDGDALRLEQVLVNLLDNALRYAPVQGVVHLEVARTGTEARMVVDDGGIGVPDEALAMLGERLYTVDPARSRGAGTHGLGLAIARSIVEHHGGRLRFERSPRGGLRALATLPALALLLLTTAAHAQPGPGRRADPWHVDVEAVTDFPIEVGAHVGVEFPLRFRAGTTLGVMPGPYAQAIDAALVAFGAFPQPVGDLIDAALANSLVWRTHVGWRPFPRLGFYVDAGYGMVTLGGSIGSVQLLEAAGRAPPPDASSSSRSIHVASTLHMLDAEVGWTFLVARWVPVRVALGFAGTLAASSTIYFVDPAGQRVSVRPATQNALDQSAAWLDGEYRGYVFTGVVTVAVGFRPY